MWEYVTIYAYPYRVCHNDERFMAKTAGVPSGFGS
ncbi:MAG: hypothetical protein RLZZ338_1247 [Cyanobacteriota bacterium]|jgi:hypothetical protein